MSCNNSSSGSSSNNNALSLSCIIIVAELLGVCCLKIIACLRGQQTATCQRSSLQRRRLPVSDAIICKIRLSTVIHQTQSAVYSLQLAVCSLQSEILSSLLAFRAEMQIRRGNVKNAQIAVCNSSGPSRLLLLLPLPVASCKLLLHLQTIANNYLCGPGAACCKYLLEKSGCHFGIGYCATPQPLFFLAHQAVNDQSTWSSPYPGQSIIMLPYI